MSKLTHLSFAWRVILIYVAVSVVWKLLSLITTVLLADNINSLALWETLQASLRIAATAAILYALLRHEENRRQLVEATLRQQERNYHSLAENIPDIVTRFDRQLRCIFVNQHVEAASGLPVSRFLGRTLREFSQSPEAAQIGEEILAQVIESGQAHTSEFAISTVTGPAYFEQRLIPEFGPAGEVQTVLSINRDISQRQQAEEARRAVEEQAQFQAHLLEAVGNPVLAVDLEGQIIYWNRAAETTFGWPVAAALGHSIFDMIPANVHQLTNEIITQLRLGQEWSGESVALRRDGRSFPVHVTATAIYDAQRTITGFIGVVVDITERKQAELALRESEARFATVFHHVPLAIAIVQLEDYHFVDVNEMWESLTGFAREQVLGRTPLDLQIIVEPEIPQQLRQTVLEQGIARDVEIRIRQAAGSIAVLSLAAVKIDLDGEPCLLVMAMDITARQLAEQARQESERRYRAVVEDQTELIVRFRADDTFLFVNEAYCRFFGKSREELLGRQWQPDALPDDLPLIKAQLATLSPQHPVVVIENRALGGNGVECWLQFTNRGFFDEAGQLIEIQAVGRDITQRKLAEDALRLSEQRFRRALENIPDVVVIYDPDLRIRYVNPATYRLTGRAAEEFVGRRDEEVWPPEIYTIYLPTLRQALETRQTCVLVTELTLLGSDNRNLQITCVPVLDELGAVREILGITHDFTERQRAAEALRVYAERLKVLHEVGRASLAGQLPQNIAEITLELLQQLLPYHRGTITWISSQTQDAVGVTRVNDRPVDAHRLTASLASTDEQRLTINTPLQSRNELIGTLNLQADRATPFVASDMAIAREAAEELALAIQHAQLFEQVRAGRDRMERLSRRLLDVQETERRAIARELHDEIGQALTAIKIELQGLQQDTASLTAAHFAESIGVVDQALQQVRDLSLDLRPSLLDDLGLPAALRWYVDRQAQRSDLLVELNVDTVRERLAPNLETVCFRVVQEAVTNIIRHAHAQRVYVELARRDNQLLLTVQDDGRGFEVDEAHARAVSGASLGLLGMEERIWLSNGEVEIESTSGKGTTVRARLPFRKREAKHD